MSLNHQTPARLGVLAILVAFMMVGAYLSLPNKGDMMSSSSSWSLPSSQRERELVLGKPRYSKKHRIASFGSSDTWGKGLPSRYEAYPYLLSEEVDNYASVNGGPNFASVCTETLIGDDTMYDVIILEFWLKADQGLVELARRLRQRFPKAVMIFLRLWGPFQARRKPTADPHSGPIMTFDEWVSTQTLRTGQLNELVDLLAQDKGYWYFPGHEEADGNFTKAVSTVGGYRIHFPQDDTCQETLVHYLRFFDPVHHTELGEKGHKLIANLTSDILYYHEKIGSQFEEAEETYDETGHWGKGDSCHLWLLTGACNFEHSDNFHMLKFDEKADHYALEIDGPGWMDVKNPFDSRREFYVSFVSTSTHDFPDVKLEYDVETSEGAVAHAEYLMDPDHTLDTHHAGVIRTMFVGRLHPGMTRVTFTPRDNAPNPFLLVGATFTNGIAEPMEYGFGPGYTA